MKGPLLAPDQLEGAEEVRELYKPTNVIPT